MLSFIVKRFWYSLLIVAGVILLTFGLFRVAAGDPAAAVLGKNPSPKEVEDLRNELGADLPLFYGRWRKTEAFSSVDFTTGGKPAGVEIPENAGFSSTGLNLKQGIVKFKRNFESDGTSLLCKVNFKGGLEINGKIFKDTGSWQNIKLEVSQTSKEIYFKAAALSIGRVEFFRRQKSPLNSQFFRSIKEIISFRNTFPYVSFFNFGRTIITREPIRNILWRGVGPSLSLMLPIFLGEIVIGICLALLATAFRERWPDRLLMLFSVSTMSISYLVFIILGQWFLAYSLNLFPVWGWGSLINLALPIIIGIACGVGSSVRFYRTVFVNELNREYLRTAAAKGCSPFKVYTRHLLRNAAIPIITRATAALPFLFTGSLLLETFFGIPGLGYLGVEALNNSDLQLLKALVIISAILFVTMNTLADIAYAWADPRIRLK